MSVEAMSDLVKTKQLPVKQKPQRVTFGISAPVGAGVVKSRPLVSRGGSGLQCRIRHRQSWVVLGTATRAWARSQRAAVMTACTQHAATFRSAGTRLGSERPPVGKLRRRVRDFATRVLAVIDTLDFDQKQTLLRLIVEEVHVTGWHVQIRLRIPLDDNPDGPPRPPNPNPGPDRPGPMSTKDRLRSLGSHQSAVPAQDRGRSDQAVTAQALGEAPDQRGEHRSVGPVQARPRVGSAKYGDLVAQHEQLDVFGRGCPAEQQQPAEEPAEDQVEQAKRHGHDHAGPLANADHRRSRTQADFWNPTGSPEHPRASDGPRHGWAATTRAPRASAGPAGPWRSLPGAAGRTAGLILIVLIAVVVTLVDAARSAYWRAVAVHRRLLWEGWNAAPGPGRWICAHLPTSLLDR